MKGIILDFDIRQNKGFISGDDDQRYQFIGSEWMEQKNPMPGQRVDFEIGDTIGEAKSVFIEVKATTPLTQNGTTIFEDEEEQYNMFDWFAKCIKNYVNFEGRARRKEFWYYMLVITLINMVLIIIAPVLTTLWFIFVLLPTLAVSIRRLHDVNMTGWWYLLTFTGVGAIPLIIWWATDTDPEENRWGLPARKLE